MTWKKQWPPISRWRARWALIFQTRMMRRLIWVEKNTTNFWWNFETMVELRTILIVLNKIISNFTLQILFRSWQDEIATRNRQQILWAISRRCRCYVKSWVRFIFDLQLWYFIIFQNYTFHERYVMFCVQFCNKFQFWINFHVNRFLVLLRRNYINHPEICSDEEPSTPLQSSSSRRKILIIATKIWK